MKTIEQKAKAYDEAIKMIKDNLDALNENIGTGLVAVNIQAIKNCFYRAFPELCDSEDEKIRKALIALLKFGLEDGSAIAPGFNETKEQGLAWLEKQGEQKPIDKIQLGKKYKCIASPRYSTFMTGEIYKPEDEFLCSLMNFCSDCFEPIEEDEHNSTNKVDPKFKVGDWVVWQGKCYKVNYNGCGYELIGQDGLRTSLEYGTVDTSARLWDITKDAKDGDVLVNGDEIVIFKKSTFNEKDLSGCMFVHCKLCDKKGYWYTIGGINPTNYTPATKEQRDTLMKAMTDAGYTFDFEKKELKKIVQSSTEWSEKDEVKLKFACALIRNTSLKGNDEIVEATIDWLKSLKERYIWKPSDEQMKALANALSLAKNCGEESAFDLRTLHEDLKKLTE